MTVFILDYQTEDTRSIEQLFPVLADEQDILRILESPNLIKAYSANVGQMFVGLVIAWKNNFHPYCTYFRILVDPLYEQYHVRKKFFKS